MAGVSLTDKYRLEATIHEGYIFHPANIRDSQGGIWKTGVELGREEFGFVRVEHEQDTRAVRALKVISKQAVPSGFDYRRELQAMAALDHDQQHHIVAFELQNCNLLEDRSANEVLTQCILGFKGWLEDDLRLYIAMEVSKLV